MAKVSYNPERGADPDIEQYGIKFADGKPSDVPDDHPKLAKFAGNPFFTVHKAKAPPADKDEGLKAVHVSNGRFVIKNNGEVIKEGLNKADAAAFNAMSDEEKAEYVKD
jgi:hypothetical protein